MDPLAHTLVGATLAETRLKTRTAMAAPMLILGANAPDIDAVTLLMQRDLSLGFRRGWTHGVLAMVVLPVVMTGLLLLLDRWTGGRRGRGRPVRPLWLLGLGCLAVWSHPALDWLNTYGVRLLMPFDDTWFYGDALFIVDPWIWLLAATPVVLAHSASRSGVAGWVVLGVAVTALITGFEGAPPLSRLLWCVGIAGLVWLRVSERWQRHLPRLAMVCLSAMVMYIVAMVAASRLAEQQVVRWLTARDASPVTIMTSPNPAHPFRHDILVADDEHYHFLEVDWLRPDPIRISGPSIMHGRREAVAAAALAAPQIQGFARWTRFPAFVVEETEHGYRVTVSDARYARRGGGLGGAVIELDRTLAPIR